MTTNNIKLESGHEYTLSQIFSGENKIIIPDLQRDYCWGDKAWNKDTEKDTELVSGFLDSLLSFFNEKPNEKLTLGLIYGYESPRFHIQLCDGQQRITTLFLILGILNRKTDNAFRNLLISDFELNNDDKEPYLQYAIRESTLYFSSDLVCEFFLKKEVLTSDIKKMDWYFKEYDLDASIQSMIASIQTIENRLDGIIDHRKFGEFVTNNLQMIYYDMGHRTRGEETFVVINTTGEPLSATENLKPILIGNILDDEVMKKRSEEWEEREEWFWQNKLSDEQTSDNGLNVFFIWFWQIRLLQEKSWKDKKSNPLNPKDLFLKKPTLDENNEENPDTESWEESIKPDTIQRYFIALQKLIERSKELKVAETLRTIQNEDITPTWFRESNLYVVLPLIAYLEKFSQGAKFYEFVRRIRKNYFDKKWEERNCNYLDWRHIIQIIEFSDTEEQVLLFETKSNLNRFKKISNVALNEWYNEEEKIKSVLKSHSSEIEKWEDHQDFMGDLTFLFSINDMLSIKNSNENLATLQKYYKNYNSTVDLIRNKIEKPETAKISNLFRLFQLYNGCSKVEHKPRVSWDIEGVVFSSIDRSHLKKERFKELCACNEDKLESYCSDYIVSKIKEWNLFEITEHDFSSEKMIKCWLTLKAFKANKENECLAYYDGRNGEEGVSAYLIREIEWNKLLKHEPISIENMLCGFGVKSGGGGSYISYNDDSRWLKTNIIDTPFAAVSLKKEDRTVEQLIANKKEINAIIDSIFNN
ncbi:MAG TPA: DUF262 domain-containing protein [Prolixibacteraceae bacterium]|nr:DUF262 domain-containing protein [Prolixibacteraceae bacterium]